MPHRRIIPLLPLILLIFACNLPKAIPTESAVSLPATTTAPAAADTRQPDGAAPSASPTERILPERTKPPTIFPPISPGPETVDEFFAGCPPREEINALLTEIPITFDDRTCGASKINHLEIYRAAWHVLVTAVRRPAVPARLPPARPGS